MLIIKGGEIHDGIKEKAMWRTFWWKGGKIKRIGKNLKAPKGQRRWTPPGFWFIPASLTPTATWAWTAMALAMKGRIKTSSTISSPPPQGPGWLQAHAAHPQRGCPGGSDHRQLRPRERPTKLGGTFIAVKTVGSRVDDMVVKQETAMKCALGRTPKRVYKEKTDSSRMTTAAKLRETLFKAQEYLAKKEAAGDDLTKQPAFDMKMEAMIPVMKGEIPLKAHAHATEDLFTAIRIAKEFGVKLTLEHVTEGHLIAEDLARENTWRWAPPSPMPPSLSCATKTFDTPGVLAKAGCQVSIITDAPAHPPAVPWPSAPPWR